MDACICIECLWIKQQWLFYWFWRMANLGSGTAFKDLKQGECIISSFLEHLIPLENSRLSTSVLLKMELNRGVSGKNVDWFLRERMVARLQNCRVKYIHYPWHPFSSACTTIRRNLYIPDATTNRYRMSKVASSCIIIQVMARSWLVSRNPWNPPGDATVEVIGVKIWYFGANSFTHSNDYLRLT